MAVCGGCRAEVVPGSEVCPVCDSLVQQPDPLPNILAQSGEPQVTNYFNNVLECSILYYNNSIELQYCTDKCCLNGNRHMTTSIT